MTKTIFLLLFVACLAAHAQSTVSTNVACIQSQGLVCAGGFQSTVSAAQPVITTGPCTPIGYPYSAHSADFSGGYQDFVSQPDGTLTWSSYQTGQQSLIAYDGCYQPCSTDLGFVSIYLGLPCPRPTGTVSPVGTPQWSQPTYSQSGSLSGGTPEYDNGIYNCNTVSAGVGYGGATITTNVTLCFAQTQTQYGSWDGAPNHCVLVVVGNTPPVCYCGEQSTCDQSTNTFVCPATDGQPTVEQYSAEETCAGIDNGFCICYYVVTDTYVCGSLQSREYNLIEEDCALA